MDDASALASQRQLPDVRICLPRRQCAGPQLHHGLTCQACPGGREEGQPAVMPRRLLGMVLAAAGVAVWACPAMLAAQPAKPGAAAKSYKPKLTAWGEPDLRGTWPIDYLNGLVLERDPKYGNRAYLSDAEYAEAKKRQDALQARYENDDKDGKIGRGH